MKNLLITGGIYADRLDHAQRIIEKSLCTKDSHNKDLCPCCNRITNNNHPNLVCISPDEEIISPFMNRHEQEGVIKIEQVRRIIVESQKHNFESNICIFLITNMDRITISAANALLKVIEESPDNKAFIALAPSRSAVFPTIASRLITKPIIPTSLDLQAPNSEARQLLLEITETKPKDRLPHCSSFSHSKNECMLKLEGINKECHLMLRNKLIDPKLALKLLESVNIATTQLSKNINTRLTIENMLFNHWPYIE